VVVLVVPVVEETGGIVFRFEVVELAPPDELLDVVWLKAGKSKIAAAAAAIPRVRH
jgi:hypothetical protein